jgi:hypothetical protein
MNGRETDWKAIVRTQHWGERVTEALQTYFRDGRPLMTAVHLVETNLEADQDAVPVLRAIYDVPYSMKRIGLRRRLDRPPMTDTARTPADSLAEEIAFYEISEPLGRQFDLLVEDRRGIWWWGDGYPSLSEHSDFVLKANEQRRIACLFRATFTPYPLEIRPGTLFLSGVTAVWTPSTDIDPQPIQIDTSVISVRVTTANKEALRIVDRPQLVAPILLPSPCVVECMTPFGRLEFIVSPVDATIVASFFEKRIAGQTS